MKYITLVIMLFGIALAEDPPKTPPAPAPAPTHVAAQPQQDDTLSSEEVTKLENLQLKLELLNNQIRQYEAATKAAHPTLKIRLDVSQGIRWIMETPVLDVSSGTPVVKPTKKGNNEDTKAK